QRCGCKTEILTQLDKAEAGQYVELKIGAATGLDHTIQLRALQTARQTQRCSAGHCRRSGKGEAALRAEVVREEGHGEEHIVWPPHWSKDLLPPYDGKKKKSCLPVPVPRPNPPTLPP